MVEPFRFSELPQLSRAEAALSRRFRGAARALDVDALEAALGELVRTAVSLRLAGEPRRGLEDATLGDGAAVLFQADRQADGPGPAVLVDVEPALANGVVARALDQRSPRIPGPTAVADVLGAFAAVLHAALRRAFPVALRVAAAGPLVAIEPVFRAAARGAPHVTARLLVSLGGESFGARISVPDVALAEPEVSPFTLDALHPDTPLALPLVLSSCFTTRAELSLLAPGDAFVVTGAPLREEDGALLGPVALAAPESERAIGADLAAGERLVLRTGEPTPWESPRMTDVPPNATDPSTAGNAELSGLEDAPVVVRVELGSVSMTAKEWAALGPGDAIALGRRVGAPAILRVGGIAVAEGELVRIDGEYGVRILRREGDRGTR